MSRLVGRTLGRYRLESLLGRGGMAEVYRGVDEVLERPVAVKVLRSALAGQEEVEERFLREARVVASLDHPNIVPIFDLGSTDDGTFLVMPLLDGGSLARRLAAGPAPALAKVVRWMDELGAALDAAHAAGVLHRDVKPSNVLLGREERVLLADFGIARLLASATRLTATGSIVGTPAYMAPELARGERASEASDRYSFAVVCWELLAGAPPFEGETPLSVLHQHVNTPVPALSGRRPTLDPEVDPLFRRCLAKEPADRPGSCALVVAELRRALGHGLSRWDEVPTLVDEGWRSSADPASTAEVGGPIAASAPLAPPIPRERRSTRRRGLGIILALGLLGAGAMWVARERGGEEGGPSPAVGPAMATATVAAGDLEESPSAPTVDGEPLPDESTDPPAVAQDEHGAEPELQRPAATASPRVPVAVGRSDGPAGPDLTADRIFDRWRWLLRPEARLSAADLERGQLLLRQVEEPAERLAGHRLRAAVARYLSGASAYLAGHDDEAWEVVRSFEARGPGLEMVPWPVVVVGLGRDPEAPREPWELAVAYGDLRREAASGLGRARRSRPEDLRVALATAYLAHLDGRHGEAAVAGGRIWQRLASEAVDDLVTGEVARFVAYEWQDEGDPEEMKAWLERAVEGLGLRATPLVLELSLELERAGREEELERLRSFACRAGVRAVCPPQGVGPRRDRVGSEVDAPE